MKKMNCKMCDRGFYCPSGKHTKKPGKIHSGRGSTMDSQWDCPNCSGRGFILISIIDRIALAIYARGRRVHRKGNPISY